jgi:glycosyltransferase involved in cell wall biosynthesis
LRYRQRKERLYSSLAIVDVGSFVLPYDFHLVSALAKRGCRVMFFASETRFNPEFLDALRSLPGVEVVSRPVSRSVSGRGKAGWSYLRLLWNVWCRRDEYDAVSLQFVGRWQIELPFWWLLRKKLIFTVHNAVPHDFHGRSYWPYRVVSGFARKLWFLSAAVAEDFHARYPGDFRGKSRLVQMGTQASQPHLPQVRYVMPERIEGLAYWSTVKPYKGIELMLALAHDRRARSGNELLEVHGRWAPDLQSIRQQLNELGVEALDRYLSADELLTLLSRDLVFVLPYRSASQSAAMYTLLHHGRFFMATDVGDLGDLLRRFGLESLILRDPTVASVRRCIAWLEANLPYATARFSEAQAAMSWDAAVDAILDDELLSRRA